MWGSQFGRIPCNLKRNTDLVQEPAFDIHDGHITQVMPPSLNGRSRGLRVFISRIDANLISGLSRSFSGMSQKEDPQCLALF